MTRAVAGIGVGLRNEIVAELPETTRQLDWLEIIPENWANIGGISKRRLDACRERWPLVPHSTALSIGGPDPFDAEYLASMRTLCAEIDAPWFSDHICYSLIGGMHTHELLPLPFSDEAVDHTIRRIDLAQQHFEVPLVFENPSYYARMPGGTMDEATFLRRIVEGANCGMLLDVNNVYVNSQNHRFDPYEFVDRMPLERVCQLHLAGHQNQDELIIDTHEGPIIDPVWALYRHVIRRAGRVIPTLIEWDTNVPALDEVLDEADRARRHAAEALELPDAA